MYPKVYVVRGSTGGVLYWGPSEALLFMSEGNDGSRMNYMRYVLEPLLVSMGKVRQPDNERCSKILVIQLTDKAVQSFDTDLNRYTGEPTCTFRYELFNGHFYAPSWPK